NFWRVFSGFFSTALSHPLQQTKTGCPAATTLIGRPIDPSGSSVTGHITWPSASFLSSGGSSPRPARTSASSFGLSFANGAGNGGGTALAAFAFHSSTRLSVATGSSFACLTHPLQQTKTGLPSSSSFAGTSIDPSRSPSTGHHLCAS